MRWLLFVLFFSSNLLAKDFYVPTGTLIPSAPRDSYKSNGVTEWSNPFTADVLVCGFFQGVCANASYLTPQNSSGLSYVENGKTYTIYNVGDSQIGVVYEVKDNGASTWIPVTGSLVIPIRTGGNVLRLDVNIRVKLVTPASRGLSNPTLINIPGVVPIGILTNNLSGGGGDMLYLQARSFSISPTTCTISSDTNNINIAEIKDNQFPSLGSVGPESVFNLSLNCPTGITVKGSFIDILHPGNKSNELFINENASGAAHGVSIQVMKKTDNIPLYLGNDSSVPGSINQTTLISSNNILGNQTQNFAVRLIRTGDITPGYVNAKMGITFSYQ